MKKIKFFLLSQKGVALIISVSLLALLTILGITFTVNMRLEEKDSSNFMAAKEAEYLAEAGINRAIAELKELATTKPYSDPNDPWYYKDGAGIDITEAVDPSFNDGTGVSETIVLGEGRTGTYTLKVLDCGSQIYINDDNPNIETMLNDLGRILGSPCNGDEGTAIINNRPANGYRTKEEIRLSGISQGEYDALKDYITVYAFVDEKVIDPLDKNAFLDESNPSSVGTPGSAPYYEFQPRAPVNINTASQEVLEVLMTDLACGLTYDNSKKDGWAGVNEQYFLPVTISSTEASQITTSLISNRPFTNWHEVYDFLEGNKDTFFPSASDPVDKYRSKEAATVFSNFNPNTDVVMLRYVNPNYSFRKTAGKTDLTAYTTEGSLNSNGYYDIESIGRVLGPTGSIVAEKKCQATVQIFDIIRQTTQAEFEDTDATKLNVTSYPEPIPAGITAADYDGHLMIALRTATTPDSGTHYMLSTFNSGFNAVEYGAGGDPVMYGSPPRLSSVVDPNKSNILPDGYTTTRSGFAKRGGWYYACNADGKKIQADAGVMSFWFKPAWYMVDMGYPWMCVKPFMTAYRYTYIPEGETESTTQVRKFYSFFKGNYLSTSFSFCLGYGPSVRANEFLDWQAGDWIYVLYAWHRDKEPDPETGEFTSWTKVTLNGGELGGERLRDISTIDPLITEWKGGFDNSASNYSFAVGYDYFWFWTEEHLSGSIDELRIFPPSDGASIEALANQLEDEYLDGRYMDTGERSFISKGEEAPADFCKWGTITWTELLPSDREDFLGSSIIANADIRLQVETATSSGGLGGGSWSSDYNNPEDENTIDTTSDQHRWIKYKATFLADSGSVGTYPSLRESPILDDVTITYLPQTKILYWRE